MKYTDICLTLLGNRPKTEVEDLGDRQKTEVEDDFTEGLS